VQDAAGRSTGPHRWVFYLIHLSGLHLEKEVEESVSKKGKVVRNLH
jgi:hypothetical protein